MVAVRFRMGVLDYPQSLCDSIIPSHFVTAPRVWRLFTPGVEPAEVFTMPHQGILRLENPMVFLREDQKS